MKKLTNLPKAPVLVFFMILQSMVLVMAQTKRPQTAAPPSLSKKLKDLAIWHLYRNDSLHLLWIPVKSGNWVKYNEVGYHVERAERLKGRIKVYTKLTTNPIRPVSAQNWNPDSPESSVAKKALYEVNAKDTINDFAGRKLANQQNFRHTIAMMVVFKSKKIAQQMGLSFVDTGQKRNTRYVYKIYPNLPKSEKFDTTYIAVETYKPTIVKHPPILKAESLEHGVALSWPSTQYATDFIMYHVERSVNGVQYEKLTDTPHFQGDARLSESSFKDSLTQNYRPYLYRLVGMTPFGEWITSQMPVMAMGSDKTPPAQPIIESAKHVGGSKVEIKWKMPVNEGDLKGFWVGRASGVSSKYNKIAGLLPRDVNTVSDLNADITGTNHYMVFAVDTAGNERASFPTYVTLVDSLPPAAPQGLAAKVTADKKTSMGIVSLAWSRNTEKDLQGYYVYFANDPDHEFSQVTKRVVSDTTFSDTITLKSLTKKVFYKVVAVDKHFNISGFSEVLFAKRPDIIKPIAPLITSVQVKDSIAIIEWQKSPSNDVIEYRLYRREKSNEWSKLVSFSGGDIPTLRFVDRLTTNFVYEYYVEVVDESGLVSDPSPSKTTQRRYTALLFQSPQVSVTYNDQRKINVITWRYQGTGQYRLTIYRAEGRGGYQMIGSVSAKDNEFIDNPQSQGKYRYAAKAIHEDGRESRFSEPVQIKMQ